MDTLTPISGFVLAVGAAFLGGYLVRCLKLPPMVGYLLAGVALAPLASKLLTEKTQIQALAELGVAFLLFQAGTEFPMSKLKSSPWSALVGPLLQLVLTVPLVVLAVVLTNWSILQISLMAVILYLSSTAVTVKLLSARNELDTNHGRIAVTFSIVQNITLILAIVYMSAIAAPAEKNFLSLVFTVAKAVGFLLVVYFIGARLAPKMLSKFNTNGQELFVLGGVFLALGMGLLAQHMGLSLSTGAFFAGVVVASSATGRQIRQDLSPISDLFVTFFFVSIGLLLNVGYLTTHIPTVIFFLAAIIIGKVAILAIVFSLFNSSRKDALLTALILGQIGEEAFLVINVAMVYGIMSTEVFSLVVAGSVISIALNPILVMYAPALSKAPQGLPAMWKGIKDTLRALPGLGLRRHAIVCGYGSVGQKVAQALALNGVSFVVVEQAPARLALLKENGLNFIAGDPASEDVLKRVNISEARSLIVTLPDPLATERIIEQAKRLQPDLGVVSIHPSYDDRLGFSSYVLRHHGMSSSILKKLLVAAKSAVPSRIHALVEPL